MPPTILKDGHGFHALGDDTQTLEDCVKDMDFDPTANDDSEVESLQATLPVHPGHIWAACEGADVRSSLESSSLEWPELLRHQHREVMRRLDYQDNVLRQALVHLQTVPVPYPGMPVAKFMSTSSAPSTRSSAMSPRSKNSSVDVRRPSVTSNNSFTPPAPKLFSTFTQFNLALKDNAESVHETSLRSSPLRESCDAACRRIVDSSAFDIFFALVVFTNSVFIGVEVQVGLGGDDQRPLAMQIIQYTYTGLLLGKQLEAPTFLPGNVKERDHSLREVSLTVKEGVIARETINHGIVEHYKLIVREWMWTWLDLFIVLSSLWEVIIDIIYIWQDQENKQGTWKTDNNIPKSLFWAVVLLGLIVYVFSVLFTQIVNDELLDGNWSFEQKQQALRYFGDLYRTMLSLFMSIAGGVSWEAVLAPLEDVSHLWAMTFVFYISFTYFAVLNVVTGVFCHSAIESAQHDHAAAVQSILEDKEEHVGKVRELFSKFGAASEGGITFAMLQERLGDPAVREYLETLGLDISDAWSFFKLLDMDGGGSVEIEEFLMGCLRLRGAARAIDVSKIIHDQTWLIKNQGKFQTYVEVQMAGIQEEIAGLRRVLKQASASASFTSPSMGAMSTTP
ncbi:hypothetical protein AK812_SmicGene7394 [Symbiodinium microadriaticum]|uniref:EF-hand domain-containing protein n=1 Tax=Symbiodinium microadriaticum TaxID=2951 RepID=A0A1Q9ENL8_SYMMI|nr:hypothetical protein AK812_SmicGene7394 [Symbiodinium microadriaticum]